MPRLLSDFTLAMSANALGTGLHNLLVSSRYQAEVLGLKPKIEGQGNRDNALSLQLLHPSISPIQCDVFGWSESNKLPATEHTIQAACGLMSVHGRASGKAQNIGLDYLSTLTASLAIQGILAAAIGQQRGGHFNHVSTSLLQGGLLCIGQYLAGATAQEDAECLLPGSTDSTLRPPFISAEGIVFELESLSVEPWRNFWLQAGLDATIAGQAWRSFVMRYAKAISPLPQACLELLAQLPMAKIAKIAAKSGLSISPVRSLAERIKDHHFATELQQGPWIFQSGSTGGENFPPLSAGADLPLRGIKVIESCRRIQGPLCGHLLASLGAQVIRIELPGGDPLRSMSPSFNGCSVRFDALNRLKQVREIDIKSAQGREQIYQLVEQADVFIHNWAPGKAAQLRLDHDDLIKINPMLVYAYASGWGNNNDPIQLIGTDFMVQAWSGIAEIIAQHAQTRGGSLFTVLDVLGGVIAAQGILAGLLNRAVNKQGAKVESSLLGAANLLCVPLVDTQQQPAISLLKGIYATKDKRLIALECLDAKQLNQLAQVLGLIFATDRASRDDQLHNLFVTQSASYWQEKLNHLGIPVALVTENLTDIVTDMHLNRDIHSNGYSAINTYWSFQ